MTLFGRALHFLREAPDDVILAAFEKKHGVRHVLRIRAGRDLAGARRRAAVDLVQQTGTRAVLEHRVLAGAQAEHALQELDALTHGVGVRERAEVAMLALARAAMK